MEWREREERVTAAKRCSQLLCVCTNSIIPGVEHSIGLEISALFVL